MKFVTASPKYLAGIFLALLVGSCSEMFSTEPVSPRPKDVNTYKKIFSEKKSLKYLLQEWTVAPGNDSLQTTSQWVEFIFEDNEEIEGRTWSRLTMKVTDSLSGEHKYSSSLWARLDGESPRYLSDTSGSGPRFYLLKHKTGLGSVNQSGDFTTLPGLLRQSEKVDFSRGGLHFHREVSGLDTLIYHSRLEESWKISEVVKLGEQRVAEAVYYYGQSGLLRCTQQFPGFEKRGPLAENYGSGRIVRNFTLWD